MEQSIEPAQKAAASAFDAGYYCAESVVRALLGERAELDLLTRVATGFCSGMARNCGPCGALSGGVIAIGAELGREQPGRPVDLAYAAVQEFVAAFELNFGARDCAVLLGCDLDTAEGQAAFRKRGLHQRCREFTQVAAGLAAGVLRRRTAGKAD